MTRSVCVVSLFVLLGLSPARAQSGVERPAPIIDMHLHALHADQLGPPPLTFCLPTTEFPAWDQRRSYLDVFMEWQKPGPADEARCAEVVRSPVTDDGVMEETLEILERRNIVAVTSGPLVQRYREAAPDRIIPSLMFGLGPDPVPVDSLRAWFERGVYSVLAEVTIQYEGVAPDDDRFAPYLALAEELDIPVGIHIGTGPPGAPYLPGSHEYRARLHSPLLLEEVLVRHPKLRVFIGHAGWPMGDDLLALMWAHPQVYVDLGVISFVLPPAAFHSYLRRIVETGFGNRVLFGSDQMVWPGAIEVAIQRIESADYLTDAQKRDILYNNAARFLRLTPEQIAVHHGH
jgi:uncharacterized protein